MIDVHELDELRDDLGVLLAEVLGSTLGGEEGVHLPGPFAGPAPEGGVGSRLAILDGDGRYLVVRVLASAELARMLAVRMFAVVEPGPGELDDAVGELGNIAAGNVKSLLASRTRLSLPLPDPRGARTAGAAGPPSVAVRAAALGAVAEMVLTPDGDAAGLPWPPDPDGPADRVDETSETDELLETPR